LLPGQIYESQRRDSGRRDPICRRAGRGAQLRARRCRSVFTTRWPTDWNRRSDRHVRWGERRRLRSGQGRVHRQRRRVPQGGDAAGHAAGRRPVPGRAVVTLPGNSGQRPGVVRGVPCAGAAFGHGAHGDPAADPHRGDRRGAASPPGRRQFRRGLYDPSAGTVRLVGGPRLAPACARLAVANCRSSSRGCRRVAAVTPSPSSRSMRRVRVVGLIGWIVLGAIVGWAANLVVGGRDRRRRRIVSILVGVRRRVSGRLAYQLATAIRRTSAGTSPASASHWSRRPAARAAAPVPERGSPPVAHAAARAWCPIVC